MNKRVEELLQSKVTIENSKYNDSYYHDAYHDQYGDHYRDTYSDERYDDVPGGEDY